MIRGGILLALFFVAASALLAAAIGVIVYATHQANLCQATTLALRIFLLLEFIPFGLGCYLGVKDYCKNRHKK